MSHSDTTVLSFGSYGLGLNLLPHFDPTIRVKDRPVRVRLTVKRFIKQWGRCSVGNLAQAFHGFDINEHARMTIQEMFQLGHVRLELLQVVGKPSVVLFDV